MKDKQQLHDNFLSEFTALLKKYNATFEVLDRGGCGEYYSNNVPCVEFPGLYSPDDDFSVLELPGYINPD